MSPIRIRPFLLLACSTLLSGSLPAADPVLTAMIDGQPAALAGVDPKPHLLAGPDRRAVPDDAGWTLDLDAREHAALIRWAPTYSIVQGDERLQALYPDKPYRATVEFTYVSPETAPASTATVQGADWGGELPSGGAAVIAWLVEGRAVQVVARALPSTKSQKSARFETVFALTAEQALSGQPVLLLWAEGGWLPVVSLFGTPAGNAAMTAVMLDDVPALEAALAAGAKPDALSRAKVPLAVYAAEAGSARCLAALAKRHSKVVGQADPRGWTALHAAAANGREAAVTALIAARARVKEDDSMGRLAITLPVERGHTAVVAALVKAGAPIDKGRKTSAVLAKSIDKGRVDIAELLFAAKAPYDFKTEAAGRQLLMQALAGQKGMVRWLVAGGVDANYDFQGTTALALAAKDGDAESAHALVAAGAEVNRTAKGGQTALMAAADAGNTAYAGALLEAGADVRAATESGFTALHFAAKADSPAVVALLLERGADIAARNRSDATALDVALLNGSANAARELATRGASISLGASSAERLIEAALRHDIVEPIEAALGEGWPADSTIAGVWPAVRITEIFGSRRCLEALLNAGAAPPDQTKPTPLVRAAVLDQPIRAARMAPADDPRPSHEVFPETQVRVSILIDSEGRPLFPKIHESPDARLGPAAVECLMKCRFVGPRSQGNPVAVRVVVPITFPASEDRAFPLGEVTQKPKAMRMVPPVYPYLLKKNGVQGEVVVSFVVTKEGKPTDLYVVRSSHAGFEQPALDAIAQWVFEPGRRDGKPVHTRSVIQLLKFNLTE